MDAFARHMNFIKALRGLRVRWETLRACSWGFCLSRLYYGVSCWGQFLSPRDYYDLNVATNNKLARIVTATSTLGRVETLRVASGIPGAWAKFNLECISVCDLVHRARKLFDPAAVSPRQITPPFTIASADVLCVCEAAPRAGASAPRTAST